MVTLVVVYSSALISVSVTRAQQADFVNSCPNSYPAFGGDVCYKQFPPNDLNDFVVPSCPSDHTLISDKCFPNRHENECSVGETWKPAHSENGHSVPGRCVPNPPSTKVGLTDTEYFTTGYFLIAFTSRILYLGGLMLDSSLRYFVFEMGTFVRGGVGGAIEQGWTVIRDIINLTFVFGLIYAGLMTIIKGEGQTQKMLVAIILGALMINFSMYFAKIIIDITNVATFEIYNQMTTGSNPNSLEWGISGLFMDKLGLLTLMDGSEVKFVETVKSGGITFSILVSIFFLITFLVFIAGAILVTIRFIALLILLIFAPIAFAPAFLPYVGGLSKEWWDKLIANALFAPAFMLMVWFSVNILKASTLTSAGTLASNLVNAPLSTEVSVSSTAVGATGAALINFVLAIGLMIGSLIVAKKIGALGASTAVAWGNSTRKWAVNNMVKRPAGAAARGSVGWASKGIVKQMDKAGISTQNMFSRAARSPFEAGANAKFGTQHSSVSMGKQRSEWQRTASANTRQNTLHASLADPATREQALLGATVADLEHYGIEDIMKDPEMVGQLTHSQFEGIIKNADLTDAQRDELRKTRGIQVIANVNRRAAGATGAHTGVSKASKAELEAMGIAHLNTPAVAIQLTDAQISDLKPGEKFTESQINTLKETRKNAMIAAVSDADPVIAATKAATFFAGKNVADISKLPPDVLKNENAMEYISAETLRKIQDAGTMSKTDRIAISENIKTHPLYAQREALNYLNNNNRGKDFAA